MNKNKFPFIFALVIAVTSFLQSQIGSNHSIVGSLVGSLVGGVVAFLILRVVLIFIQKSQNKNRSDMLNKYTGLIAYEPVNYFKSHFICAIGGMGFLYQDRMIFISHAMNLYRK